MEELKIQDHQEYFNNNYPFSDPPKLTEKRECLHCGETIIIGDFKVFKDNSKNEYICCPNAPRCDGTVIDWMPVK